RIRAALADGRAEEAARLLGRPHRLRGLVVRGAGRGAGLGFPTANLRGIDTQVPADAVYAARAFLESSSSLRPAAAHIRPNAAFGEHARSVEVHLIDYAGDLYGRRLEIDLLARLRTTRKFAGVEELLDQMRADVAQARQVAGGVG